MSLLQKVCRIAMAPCFNRRVGGSFAIELQKRPFDHGLGVLIDKTAVRRGAVVDLRAGTYEPVHHR